MGSSRRPLLFLTLALSALGCGSDDRGFDLARARAHVEHLAGAIGSRPIGTAANEAARVYIAAELRRLGFDVRIQEADVRRGHINARVRNIIAFRAGELSEAIGLVSHYDSVPQAAGAVDDGWAVAASLEAARALSSSRWRHSLLIVITDGEEGGLLGARAVVEDPEVVRRLRAFLNFDGTGAAGPIVLFQTTPGGGAALGAWARAAPAARGGSFAIEIYRRLPNDTDFTILSNLDVSGLNFAPVMDSYAYHTDRDTAARLADETIAHAGRTMVSIVTALDRRDLQAGRETGAYRTYFSLAGQGVAYGPGVQRAMALVALIGGGGLWIWLVWRVVRDAGGRTLGRSIGFAAISATGVVVAMVVVQAALRMVRVEAVPWYAQPVWWWLAMICGAALAMWLVARWARADGREARGPALVWIAALPGWIGLVALAEWFVPAAAFLVTVPLATAVILLSIALAWSRSLRPASLVVFLLTALLWGPDTHLLLSFVVPLFGWMSVPLPAAAFPALLALAGVMVVPPLRATCAGRVDAIAASRVTGAAIAAGTVACLVLAALAPAYTAERPLRRALRYVQDDTTTQAWWDVGGREPGAEIGAGAPAGLTWRDEREGLIDQRVPPLGLRYSYRAQATLAAVAAPASVDVTASALATGRTRLRVTIKPTRPVAAMTLQLPSDIAPVESSLAGRVTGRWWSAVYLGVPDSGLDVDLILENAAADVGQLGVLLHTNDVPASRDRPTADSRTTWTTQSVFVVR